MNNMGIVDILDEADQQLMAMGGVIEINCDWSERNSGQKRENDFQLHMMIVLKEMVHSIRAKIDDASLALVLRSDRGPDGDEDDEDDMEEDDEPEEAPLRKGA